MCILSTSWTASLFKYWANTNFMKFSASQFPTVQNVLIINNSETQLLFWCKVPEVGSLQMKKQVIVINARSFLPQTRLRETLLKMKPEFLKVYLWKSMVSQFNCQNFFSCTSVYCPIVRAKWATNTRFVYRIDFMYENWSSGQLFGCQKNLRTFQWSLGRHRLSVDLLKAE